MAGADDRHAPRCQSEVTLRAGDGIKTAPAYGRVLSKKQACVEGRTVVLWMVEPESAPIEPADRPTNAKGKWEFHSQLQGARSAPR